MEQDYTSLPYIISNIVAVFIVVSAMLWPTIARVLLSTIFIAAFAFNLSMVYGSQRFTWHLAN